MRMKVRRKAQRRSYLKRFDASVLHIKDIPLNAPKEGEEGRYHTFAIKARSKAAQETFTNDSEGKMMLPILRDSRGNVFLQRTEGPNVIPRAEVFLKLWQGIRRQGMSEFHSITLEQGKWNKVQLFFSGSEFIVVETKGMQNIVRRSIIYRTRDLALRAHERGNVIWEQWEKLNT